MRGDAPIVNSVRMVPRQYLSIYSRCTAQERKWQTEGVGGGSVSWYPWRGWRWAYMGILGLLGLYMK